MSKWSPCEGAIAKSRLELPSISATTRLFWKLAWAAGGPANVNLFVCRPEGLTLSISGSVQPSQVCGQPAESRDKRRWLETSPFFIVHPFLSWQESNRAQDPQGMDTQNPSKSRRRQRLTLNRNLTASSLTRRWLAYRRAASTSIHFLFPTGSRVLFFFFFYSPH